MGVIKKLILLALLALSLYYGYKNFFVPVVSTGKSNVGNFYGNVSLPKP